MSKPSRTWFVASPSTSLWPGGPPIGRVAALGASLGLSALLVPFLLTVFDDGTSSPDRAATSLGQPSENPTPPWASTTASPTALAQATAQTPGPTTATPEKTLKTPKTPEASPTPADGPSQGPTPSTKTPKTPSGRTSTTTSEPGPTFTPVTISAIDPRNTRVGAQESACYTCVSGARISYLEGSRSLTVPVNDVAMAGTRRLTIAYECGDAPRDLVVTVNGDAGQRLAALPKTADWETPGWVSLDIVLRKGTNRIKFHNPTGPAPDLDQFRIT